MSGYKRVNFYELCRLCAKNQQKDKTHIFQEEGRKIQLQNKIQTCLSLKVCENDFLPKVVCSQCLRSLEESCIFRKVCYTSETMLSSYFNNFRYTEDFKKSGKVYIKDTSPKAVSTQDLSVQTSTVSTTTTAASSSDPVAYNINTVPSVSSTRENVPYYTLHLPSPQTNEIKTNTTNSGSSQIMYNLNAVTKSTGTFNNVTAVDSTGEIISIAPLVEIEALHRTPPQSKKLRKHPVSITENGKMIKIDLTQQGEVVQEKLKLQQQNKVVYAFKVEEAAAAAASKERLILNSLESSLNHGLFNSGSSSHNSITVLNSTSISVKGSVQGTHLNTEPLPQLHSQLNPASLVNVTPSPCYTKQTEYVNAFNTSSIPQNSSHIPSNGVNQQQRQDDQLTKKHICDICQKTFKRREHLYQHVRLHTGFRPFKCDSCNKRFMRKEHLLRHMTSHSGQKNFTCNICDKSFSRNDNLLKHKKIHAKQNSFTCEVCQKQFVMEHYYLAHKLTHESEKCGMNNPVWSLLKTI